MFNKSRFIWYIFLWAYQEELSKIPFKYWILTGEYYYYPPVTVYHKKIHKINNSIKNFCPMLLRANESPFSIGTYEKKIKYNGVYIG